MDIYNEKIASPTGFHKSITMTLFWSTYPAAPLKQKIRVPTILSVRCLIGRRARSLGRYSTHLKMSRK